MFQDPSIFTTPAIDLWNEGKPISGKKCFLWLIFYGKVSKMISCWKSDHVCWIWLSNPDLLDVMEWKKVVLNCFRKWKSFSFKVDLPLHSTEIGFGRGRLDVKSNWIYVLFSKDKSLSFFIIQHIVSYWHSLWAITKGGVEEDTIKSRCLLKIPLWPCELPFAFHPGCQISIVPWKTEERF